MSAKNPRKIVSERTGEISWRARFTYISPIDGSRKFRSKNFKTQKLALAWLAEQRAQHHAGTYFEPSKMTVGEYAERWFERRKASLRTSSWHAYRHIWKRDLEEPFGHRPLAHLRKAEIQEFVDRLGHAPRTVDQTYTLLKQILKAAVSDELIRVNPATGCTVPKAERSPVKYWSEIEVHRFLTTAAGHPSAPLWRLLITSGLRIGEALVLTWDDVDTEGCIIQVNKTLRVGANGRRFIGAGGKTPTSNRLVRIPASTIAALKHQREWNERARLAAGDRWQEGNLVFPSSRDGTVRDAGSVAMVLRRLCSEAGVEYIKPHGLRHTYASLAARQGVHMLSVKEQLGHATIAMTMDIYSHVDATMLTMAADTMERMFPLTKQAATDPESQQISG